MIKKALYKPATSAARSHSHLTYKFPIFGFTPTRYDNDVWIRRSKDKSYYKYACTHVDDFSIFSREPQKVMDQIQSVYTVKTTGPPEYYPGNFLRICICIFKLLSQLQDEVI